MLCHWCGSRAKSGRSVGVLNDLASLYRVVNWPHAVVSWSSSFAGPVRLAMARLGVYGGCPEVLEQQSSRAAVALRFHGFCGTVCLDTEEERRLASSREASPASWFHQRDRRPGICGTKETAYRFQARFPAISLWLTVMRAGDACQTQVMV